jgi:hypothetical protein
MQTSMPENIDLKVKKAILDAAAIQLKKEFVGIDNIIDQIIHAISSWYMLPHLQERPVIINLWGMTGVGKSSLVKRLSDLIQFNKRYFHYDIGELKGREFSMKKDLMGLFGHPTPQPAILVFDEFQYGRSIDEDYKETENSTMRIVWDIIDSGKFESVSFTFWSMDRLLDHIRSLQHAIKNGLKGENGYITAGVNLYEKKKIIDDLKQIDNSDEREPIIPTELLEDLYEINKRDFASLSEFWQHIYSLNEIESINLLKVSLENLMAPQTYDCSQSIIFIMGNLDEAYKISGNYNTDIDANDFHAQSLKININHIKQALKYRFRNEQIARLGNIHIIYPALNKNAYQQIINLELQKIYNRVIQQSDISLEFEPSIHHLLYKEGVFPTQGTRPVFTTIHQMISSQIGNIIIAAQEHNQNVTKISLSYSNQYIHCKYNDENQSKRTYAYFVPVQMEKLRLNTCDDMQALVAVHETGHAVTSMMLLNIVPQCILSSSTDIDNYGFVYSNMGEVIKSKNMVKKYIATILGGIAAEKIIFGDEYVTVGSSEDLKSATESVASYIKHNGLGNELGFISVESHHSTKHLHDPEYNTNNEIKAWLKEGFELAVATLSEHKELLITMSQFLSNNRCIDKKLGERMLLEYLQSKGLDRNALKNNFSYRDTLMSMPIISKELTNLNPWQLNKSKNK